MQNRRSGFLTFIAAVIPGVGYMYLGLILRGIEALAIYLLIPSVLNLVGLGGLTWMVRLVLWFYLFFDTYSIAHKLDRGETVNDTDFIFNRNNEGQTSDIKINFDENKWKAVAWALIIIGVFAIANMSLGSLVIYGVIRDYISRYFLPVLLILGGVFLLVRSGKKS